MLEGLKQNTMGKGHRSVPTIDTFIGRRQLEFTSVHQ